MPTARATLAAEHRDVTGKKVAVLRRAGRLPAVVYGHGVDSDSVSIDAHEFEQLRRHVGPNALVTMFSYLVIAKDIRRVELRHRDA